MKPIHATRIALLVTALAGLVSAAAANEPAPNILYIFTDDQSFRTVSCYPGAYNYAHTPHIDRLAETGIRFDHAYIGAKCVPSRAGMLTGRFQYACAEGPEYKCVKRVGPEKRRFISCLVHAPTSPSAVSTPSTPAPGAVPP